MYIFLVKILKKVSEVTQKSEKLDSISKKIQELVAYLETSIYNRNIKEDSKVMREIDKKLIPNYSGYLVDMEVERTYMKRPCHLKLKIQKLK